MVMEDGVYFLLMKMTNYKFLRGILTGVAYPLSKKELIFNENSIHKKNPLLLNINNDKT